MRTMLVGCGADNIAEAKTGEEALDILAEDSKELILCDYNLGEGKDGQQVLEEAKHRDLIPYSTIFILSTAENTSEMVMGAVEHQPDNYLVKPFTKSVLQVRIRKIEDKKAGFSDISTAIDKKEYQHALKLCDELLQKDKKALFDVYKIKGELYQKLSDFSTAEKIYEEVLNIHDISWAKFGLGKVQFFQDKLEDAKETFDELIADNANFVVAYDWLAKVEKAMGNAKKAQDLLAKAVNISPKGLLRQRALGEISFANEDFDCAEKAYKNVVKNSKNSCYKSPNDYGGLAKVLVKKDNGRVALRVLDDMKKEYSQGDSETKLQTALIEGVVHKDLGNDQQSIAALEQAMEIFSEQPGMLSSDSAMELAQTCFALGKKEQGNELIKHVVRNNHENTKILEMAKKFYQDMGMEEEGGDLIAGAQKEVIEVNNNGVSLAKEGKYKESIRLFTKAARAMPENLIVNLNTAQSLIMLMQQSGVSEKFLEQARYHLERARQADAGNDRYRKLLDHYHQLNKKLA